MGQGTAFMYQGRLNDGGVPANGAYDLRFALYDAYTNGNAIGLPQTNLAVPVSSGIFATNIDFGPVFNGNSYWLSIGVRTNGNTNAFTLLFPRQPLMPVPYAIFANTASNMLGTLSATQLVGTLPSAQISGTYGGLVSFTNATNAFIGKFSGNGSNLTSLNASQLFSGTVADARLSTNVALLNTNQTFTGTNTFTGPNVFTGANSFTSPTNAFIGQFTGNGGNLTNLNGSAVAFGTVADARLSGNVALLNTNQTFTGTNTFTGPNVFTGNNSFSGANSFTNRLNAFTGSFFGNGLVGWIPVSGTATQAVANAGYLLLNSSLTTVTLPQTASLFVGDVVRISGAGGGGWKLAQNAGQYVSGFFYSPTNATWVSASAGNAGWWAIASSADGVKLAAAQGGVSAGISTSPDSGVTWNGSAATFAPSSLASSADGNYLVGGIYGGSIIVSTNGGTTWRGITPGNVAWTGVASSQDGSKFAAAISNGLTSTVYVFSNYGATSNFPASTIGGGLTGIACSYDCSRLAVSSTGSVFTSADGGSTWSASGSSPANCSCIASSSDGYKLVAAQKSGQIYTSADAGATWTLQANSTSATWSSVACSSDGGRIVAVVNNGGIYISANYGVTWTKQILTDQHWKSVTCSFDGAKVAAAYATTLTTGGIEYWDAVLESTLTTTGVNGSVTGGPGTAVELQHIGNGRFMPISSLGTFWAN